MPAITDTKDIEALAERLIYVRFNYIPTEEDKDTLYKLHKEHYERMARWILENYVPKNNL